MKRNRWTLILLVLALALTLFVPTACKDTTDPDSLGSMQDSDSAKEADTRISYGKEVFSIVSGSENEILEPILEAYAKDRKITIEMNYLGSLDIMRKLAQKDFPYDAAWPAGSLWLQLGDELHRSKHSESISLTPVVFGVRESLAQELGLTEGDVSVRDLLAPIRDGKLKFCMTSSTQSNSGAMAYLGFLYALAGSPEVLTMEHLNNPELKADIEDLLHGVDRSSGSSNWLVDLFLNGDYDAMVNYEALIIHTNEILEKEGKEPLHVIYPYDGLSIADSPLAYIDQGDEKKEERFLDLQNYLLSEDVQDQIQKTGRRISYEGVSEENRQVFREDWGLQPDRILTPLRIPASDVIKEALNLYQTDFKKPSLNVYCLDYSGSMSGQGNEQLETAMHQLLDQDIAAQNLLQASDDEINIIIPFNHDVIKVYRSEGTNDLDDLDKAIRKLNPGGGTDMYKAAETALVEMKNYDLSQFQPAIIMMTDGLSGGDAKAFKDIYEAFTYDVPIFSISFGSADLAQLEDLATLSKARVFDGKDNLVETFRKVKGYN